MSQIAITDARDHLSEVVDRSRSETVFLTRRNRPVAAIVNPDVLRQLLDDAEELDDIRAVDAAWEETRQLDETPIPWDEVKRELGL
ncbi:type II toxin-antitoxin system Phd/YefM family antitoxin [Microbacterium sp. W4I20]|uniref:type II toxin-antitoxin system Phd/YefM family antitoxin n=1 Tax=Microbacterium sp. W4I20 TaxID=3042262 RepID=UPI002780B8EA|nr:type II toxin-antitoxin system Phd/YefM family antitoxin [Microbacterium sp. W4I20]MDQ0727789.1 prevent-host-death family protein [Microbacterium sp. W4I20]